MARPSVPIPSSGPSAPAPAPPRPRRRNDGVVRSSLELVFSYSRSQQRFFAGLPSAPSFVDYQWGPRGEDDDAEEGDSQAEWDGEHGSDTCDTCNESGDDTVDESQADASGFFPDDSGVFERRVAHSLSTVTEADGEVSPGGSGSSGSTSRTPLTTPAPTAIPLPSKRGMIMSFFSTTPTAGTLPPLSTSASSTGSQTPRPMNRRLPDVEGAAGLSRSWAAQQQRNLGVGHGHQRKVSSDGERTGAAVTERTPLLRTGRPTSMGKQRNWGTEHLTPDVSPNRTVGRRVSHARVRAASPSGQSGDGQTLFNAIAVLVGVGLLSMPLAFSYAGWICGTIMVVGFSWLTCHTAKLLARLIFADPTLHGYTDIGRKAFGRWIGATVNVLFCIELFAFSVAMIVLFGDSLSVALPEHSADTWKMIGFFLILPTTFLPLKLLSIPSVLSSLATFILVAIILFDGFWKTKAPGSIMDPMPTRLGPEMTSMNWCGGIGLVLAGFGGHGVMPNLARDMKHQGSLDRVFNIAFCVAATVSFLAGGAGYLMIGDTVSDEITRDLMEPMYGYPRFLNYFAVWMIVVTPLTKFGLCARPLHIAVEGLLNLAPAPEVLAPPPTRPRQASFSAAIGSAISQTLSGVGTSDYVPTDDDVFGDDLPKASISAAVPLNAHDTAKEGSKGLLRVVSRTVITAACTAAAILLPGFEKVMAFLGSFSAFLICIILPITFYLRLAPILIKDGDVNSPGHRFQRYMHLTILVVSTILMCMGTVWAFLPSSGRHHDDL